MTKIKVAAVSYLNTKPLIYGLRHAPALKEMMELSEAYPAAIARQLLQDEIDVGLVPVAIIPKMKEAHIISDYCIGATGPVASVGLYSECPLQEIQSVYLDHQSRTSIALAKILFQKYWKMQPAFLNADENYMEKISGTTAGIVIGDRALVLRKKIAYAYDLAEAWIGMTGLPFIFAAWVANKKLPGGFIRQFNNANQYGIENIETAITENPYELYDLKTYYTENISYILDEDKKKGLALFLQML